MKRLDKDALAKAITSIGNRSKILTSDIHVAAVSALAHAAEHGDVGFINRLTVAVGQTGLRRNALAAWFLAFGALTVNGDKATKAEKPFLYTKDKAFDVEGAETTPWHEFKPEPEISTVFDVQAATLSSLKAIIKRASKAQTVTHGDALDKVRALITTLETPAQAPAGVQEGDGILGYAAAEA